MLFCALALPPSGNADEFEPLERLAQPGPWSSVSQLIGYRGRVWFANSAKFVNHNSADIYSYDPRRGQTRYEAHLFSQDAGRPVVANGLLYWPFEDSRFSSGHGEYMVTDGQRWDWKVLPHGVVFHVHAMMGLDGALYAATSAWRAGLQRSDDGGASWRVVHDHPTADKRVSRFNSLAVLDGRLFVGLTSRTQPGPKLLQLAGETLRPVESWPHGQATTALATHRGWLYGLQPQRRGVERVAHRRGSRRTDRQPRRRHAGIRFRAPMAVGGAGPRRPRGALAKPRWTAVECGSAIRRRHAGRCARVRG